MPKGPRGEKRPVSSVSSMVRAMEIATGIREEEYVDEGPWTATDESTSDDEEDYELAALEVGTSKSKKQKNRKKRAPKT